jgi:hypothetical protein
MKIFPRQLRAVIIDDGIRLADGENIVDLSPITSLSGKFCLPKFPHLQVNIKEVVGPRYRGMDKIIGIWATTRAIEFSVKFDRGSLARAIKIVEDKYRKEGLDPRSKTRFSDDTLTGFVLFADLLRDLEYFAGVMAISGHISNMAPFRAEKLFTHTAIREPLLTNFRLRPSAMMRDKSKFAPRNLVLETVFDHLIRKSDNSSNKESPFLRAIAYYVKGLKQSEPITRLIWFIATIESILISNQERSSLTLIVERARAALKDMPSDLTGDIRKLYKIRSDFLHGSKNLRVELGGSELYPRGEIEPQCLMWYHEEADIAKSIAHSLIQILIMKNVDQLKFATKMET